MASARDLPISDYDARTARDVAERVADLGKRELLAVRNYEEHHKHRRTVLAQIDYYLELRGPQPKRAAPVVRGRQPGHLRGRARIARTHLPAGATKRASRAAAHAPAEEPRARRARSADR